MHRNLPLALLGPFKISGYWYQPAYFKDVLTFVVAICDRKGKGANPHVPEPSSWRRSHPRSGSWKDSKGFSWQRIQWIYYSRNISTVEQCH